MLISRGPSSYFVLFLSASLFSASAIAQSGMLDPTFGDNGVVRIEQLFPDLDNPGVHVVDVDETGHITAIGTHVTGQFGGLPTVDPVAWRFIEDGTLDPTFGDGGVSTVAAATEVFIFNDIHTFPYGGALAVGAYQCCSDVGGYRGGFVTRLRPSGAFDFTFGLVFQEGARFQALRVLPDEGRFVVIGGGRDCVAARYLFDGSLDPSFGDGGIVAVSSGPRDPEKEVYSRCVDAAFDGSGNMVFATETSQFINNRKERTWGALRLLPDGSLDVTFESTVRTDLARLSSVEVLADGRITLGGEKFSENATLARYAVDGTLDASFGEFGVAELELPVSWASMPLIEQPDGKLLVGSRDWVARILDDGSLDPAFGLDGVVTLDVTDDVSVSSLFIDSEGKILVGSGLGEHGYGGNGLQGDGFIVRLLGDGAVTTETSVQTRRLILSEPYPNPASELTRLKYSLDEDAPVRLAIYDVLGREVAVLYQGRRSAGEVRLSFDVSRLKPGLYVVRLTAGEKVATRRLIVVG